MAPAFSLFVEDKELGANITSAVESLEYESADGVADMATVTVANPDLSLHDAKVFAVGNEMAVWMGYGPNLTFIGRVQLVKPEFNFPQDGMPKLTVKGYTSDHRMMDFYPGKGPPLKTQEKKTLPKVRGVPDSSKKTWFNETISQIVTDIADRAGFDSDVDDAPLKDVLVQKAGMSDYDVVKGLANLTGYIFWVDWQPTTRRSLVVGQTTSQQGLWTLHFKQPDDKGRLPQEQDQITFRYNTSDFSTLLSFEPELSIRDTRTKIVVQVRDPKTNQLISAEVEDDASMPDTAYVGDPGEKVEDPLSSGAQIKLFFGEFSLDIQSNKRFKTAAEVELWAKQWFRRQRENFVTGKGQVIGVEALMSRQTHQFAGLGKSLDGEYYFNRVNHKMDTNGYICEFDARKIIT